MFKKPSTDLWRCGIVPAPIQSFLSPHVKPHNVVWLPASQSYCFDADPFGLWHENKLYVFVESYDYRSKHGTIGCHVFDNMLEHITYTPVLQENWHLSYPFVVESAGTVYLLPEACRSGKLTLYKAKNFPTTFEPRATLLEGPVVDPTLICVEGVWWLFYTLKDGTENSALHAAYAPHIEGPYTAHPANPFFVSPQKARCGGTAFVHENNVHLPVQESVNTYGENICFLQFEILTTHTITVRSLNRLRPDIFGADYTHGTHTLSAAGAITLFDVKRIDKSWLRMWVNVQRRFKRLLQTR